MHQELSCSPKKRIASKPSAKSQCHVEVPWHLVVGADNRPTNSEASLPPPSAPPFAHESPSGLLTPPLSPRGVTPPTRSQVGPTSDPWTLDLHGQHADEACRITRDALVRCQVARIKTLVLITGAADIKGGAGSAHSLAVGWVSSDGAGGTGKRGAMKRRVGTLLSQLKSDPDGLVVEMQPIAAGGGWCVAVRQK